MKNVALISGITGQDGSYLTEMLLDKGYEVHGIIRRSSSFNTFRIDHIYNNPEYLNHRFFLHYGDLTDSSNLNRTLASFSGFSIGKWSFHNSIAFLRVEVAIPERSLNSIVGSMEAVIAHPG